MDQHKEIKLRVKHNYSLCQKIFCCRCFGCLRADNNSLLTAGNRKNLMQKMLANSLKDIQLDPERTILDPLYLMILLILSQDKSQAIELIRYCRLNINLVLTDSNRSDVEFYIPQLCNYIVFHTQFRNHDLINMMEAACRCDFYFAHRYYMYLNSLEKATLEQGLQVFESVKAYKIKLLQILCEHYSDWMLYNQDMDVRLAPDRLKVKDIIKNYGTTEETKQHVFVEASQIKASYYPSLYYPESNYPASSFKSMINFFQDLIAINTQVSKMKNIPSESRKATLLMLLRQVNTQLPACVYIPFAKKCMRNLNLLNLVIEETGVFNTKERCLFSVSLEVYNPLQIMEEKERRQFEKVMHGPVTISNSMPRYRVQSVLTTAPTLYPQITSQTIMTSKDIEGKKQVFRKLSPMKRQRTRSQVERSEYQQNTCATAVISQNLMEEKKNIKAIFGQSEESLKTRVKRHSIFGQLKTWNMITLIVKTGDDLKQEEFGLQLIQQFDYIFKMQKLGLLLTTYEVVSMGPDFGIIEMVKDCVTIDKLYKKMKEANLQPNLSNYFTTTFQGKELDKVLSNFCKSLAAYSLVTYFVQLKDRHNGNIMLHRNGKLLHIDFGFFLSNAPGKGVELQKSVPFKLNSQYVDALGGYKSKYFQKFRRYFFKGFEAARKHQDRILILIKMIYCSSGATMGCFTRGQETVREVEARFNPPGVTNQMQLSEFCQDLINRSLDNWASNWYDKWQYWAQGILY